MVTVPGAGHTVITFSISNSAGNNYAVDFANAVEGVTKIQTLPTEVSVPGGLNEFLSASNSISTVLSVGGQYTLVETFAPSVIDLDASNETVAAGGSVSVVEEGSVGGEKVSFISGNNTFTGSTASAGGDTISGGSGIDLISTGGGQSVVYGGAESTIYLNDTVAAGDVAVLQNGTSTVYANGVSDTVFASATGSIIGGSGALYLTTDGGTVSVTGGSGSFIGFLSAGTDVTMTSGSGSEFFQTGGGSETVNAGAGTAYFEIASVSGADITINNFGASDYVNFDNQSITESTTTASSITVTLTDGSTVDFVGITSLSGHTY
jgi:hypothetical protein